MEGEKIKKYTRKGGFVDEGEGFSYDSDVVAGLTGVLKTRLWLAVTLPIDLLNHYNTPQHAQKPRDDVEKATMRYTKFG